MNELRHGFRDALVADTLTSAISAGSPSTTVIQLDGVEILKWARRDIVHVTGTGGTVANNLRVVRITNVDTTLDRVTVYPALAATPAAADTINGGVKEWCLDDPQDAGSPYVRYGKPRYSAPLGDLLDDERSKCVVLYGSQPLSQVAGPADAQRWELRAISPQVDWAEGLAHRYRKLFHGAPGGLTVAAYTVTDLLADEAGERGRDDSLYEWMVVVAASLSEIAA